MILMLMLHLLLVATIVGIISYTVFYCITKYNLLDTLKAALRNAGTAAAQKALASGFTTIVEEKGENKIEFSVLVEKTEKMKVTVQCEGVSEDIHKHMLLKNKT